MEFDEALAYLLSLGHETLTIKLGLHNTETLLTALGNPQRSFRSVQIAGTNGKGSTAVFVAAIAQSAGIRTGLYTSPHLVSITERIRINGREISRSMFARLASEVRTTAETLVREKQLETAPTFFEQVTAIALLAFSEEDIDLAILETGLGGRLDATTCAQAEIVALTPIALDHEEYLGETIEKVAFEKAAIIRPGVRAVIASQDRAVEEVILRQCELARVTPTLDHFDKKIEAVDSDGRFCITLKTARNTYERLSLGLRGRHQITNASLAVLTAEALQDSGYTIPSAAVVEGVRNAEHPGRLELIAGQPRLLLDGAHNPAGAESLANYLREFGCRPLTIVFAAMRDKKLRQIAEILFPLADQLVLTEVTNPRAADAGTLRVLATEIIDPDRIAVTTHSAEALTLALEKTPAAGMVCCTGSLYLIGELQNQLTTSAERKVAKSQTET